MKKLATLILALVLVSATALAFTGCDIMVVGYEVSYARGNEAATGEVPAANEYSSGAKITLAENPFTLENYVFGGWTDGEKTYAAGAEYTVPSRKVTLSAVWKKVEYKLDFAAGAAEATGEAPLATSCAWGETVILPENTFVYNGYAFVGWTDGKKTYAAGDEFVMPLAAVTLTAVWEKATVTYTVTFDPNNAGETWTVEVAEGKLVEKPATDPTIDNGKYFRYWTDEDGAEYDFATPVTGDITLYAKYQYRITYSLGEGVEGTAPEMQWVTGYVATLSAVKPTREGYIFKGWTDGTTTYAAGDMIRGLSSSFDLVAVWEKETEKCVVTFNPNNADEPKTWTVEVEKGKTVAKPATDPTIDNGKTFRCWTDEDGAEYDFATPVTGDITLYAKYQYRITYSLGEGVEGTAPETQWTGYRVKLSSAKPTREGYTFKGWTDGTATYQPDEYIVPKKETNLVAVWEKEVTEVTYTISFRKAKTWVEEELAKITGDVPVMENAAAGAKIVLPENPFTYPGYIFKGWADNTKGDNLMAGGAEYVMPAKNVIFIAFWEQEPSYKLIVGTDDYYGFITLPDSREGSYTNGMFEYYVEATESYVDVTFSYTITGTTLKLSGNITATGTIENNAINIAITYNGKTYIFGTVAPTEPEKPIVTFDKNGGSGADPVVEMTYNANSGMYKVMLPSATAFTAPAGYVFDKWQIGDKETNTYAAGKSYMANPGEAIVIKAIWKAETPVNEFVIEDVNGVKTLTAYNGTATNVVITEAMGIEAIGNKAFKNKTNIISIDLASTVKKVGTGAFSGMTNLKYVVLRSETEVSGNAGWVASGLFGTGRKLVVYIPSSLYSIDSYGDAQYGDSGAWSEQNYDFKKIEELN